MRNLIDYLRELTEKERSLEFYLSCERGYHFEWRDTKPFLEKSYKEEVLSVRYLNSQGLCGISYTLDLSKAGIQSAIERASFLSSKGIAAIYPELKEPYPEVKRLEFNEPSKDELLENLEREREYLFSKSYLERLERESLSFGEEEIFLIREGKVLSWKCPSFSFFISVVAKSDKKSASGYAYKSSSSFREINFLDLAREAERKARALSLSEKGKPLKVSVLFPPEVALELLTILSFSLKGDEVFKGRSYLKDKQGREVFSKNLTIIDDGLYPGLSETRPFDDEGLPQKRKELVKEGVVEGFIWDAYFGKLMGTASTGNARRPDISSPPKVDFTNLYIKAGQKSPKELIISQKFVFEVLEVLGAHTANSISGDFSFGVSGILYNEGEPVAYLCEMGLSGNIFELFKELEVGSNLTFFGDMGSPSLLFPSMDLG
ncbi:MAG: TldD/PmbA family protein [Caldimicrobium sp.]